MSFFRRFFGRGRGQQPQAPSVSEPGAADSMGQGPARQPGGFGAGPGGECLCPSCGAKCPHQTGKPCHQEECPSCGQPMTRAEAL